MVSSSNLKQSKKGTVLWTNDELKITLGYYYFIYRYNARKADYGTFAAQLSQFTGITRTLGSFGRRFGNFISVDPSKSANGLKNGDTKCKPIWDACINTNMTPKHDFVLDFMIFVQKYGGHNSIYDPFLRVYNQLLKDIDDDSNEVVSSSDVDPNKTYGAISCTPEPKPNPRTVFSKRYSRDEEKAKKAIFNANFECSIDKKHISFVTKNGKNYMEAHHLVPLNAQDDFSYSLDVDANIVCLCPNCHKKMHHGINIQNDLQQLYNNRKSLLKQSGIDITFNELMKYY